MLRLFFLVFFLLYGVNSFAINKPITIAVIAERADQMDEAFKQYTPLHDYLSKKLAAENITLNPLLVAHNFAEMASWVQSGKVDVVFEGVLTTHKLNLKTRNQLEPLLLAWRKGQREYQTIFFVRKDSGIQSLDDLNGKTIAFESPRSTSAFFVPKVKLRDLGFNLLTLDQLGEYGKTIHFKFAQSEINQAYWVHRGKADVAAINNADWLSLPEKIRNELTIIHQTKPLVSWLVSIQTNIEMDFKILMKKLLLDAHNDVKCRKALEAASRISKFDVLTAQDHENLVYWNGFFTE